MGFKPRQTDSESTSNSVNSHYSTLATRDRPPGLKQWELRPQAPGPIWLRRLPVDKQKVATLGTQCPRRHPRCYNQKRKFILHSIYSKYLRILEEGCKG